jgi:hypothetical protein
MNGFGELCLGFFAEFANMRLTWMHSSGYENLKRL